jgi:hypothetical protein
MYIIDYSTALNCNFIFSMKYSLTDYCDTVFVNTKNPQNFQKAQCFKVEEV